MCKMLLSINPEHVENILNGNKQYEFRKIQCRADVETILIYCTSPIMQVVAEASVKEVIVGTVLDVWRLTKEYAGISYPFFRKYYKGKKTAVAYKLDNVTTFKEPKMLTDFGISHPPQSFVYINATS